jgi:hypothetical protein
MENRPYTKKLSAVDLVALRLSELGEADAITSCRNDRPPATTRIIVRDLAVAGAPLRSLQFYPHSKNFNLIVRTVGKRSGEVNRINLLAPDADHHLARYVVDEDADRDDG